jgi:hypothetical protein
LLAVVKRSKRSHWLTNSSNDSCARWSASIRRTCFSTPARVASSPLSAAVKSSASGIVSHTEYESRLAVAHVFNFGSDTRLIQNRKFGDCSIASTTNCAPFRKSGSFASNAS